MCIRDSPKVNPPVEQSAVIPESKPAKPPVPEVSKAAKVEPEPRPLELDDEEEMAEDLEDVSEEIEEEIEEELGLDGEDDDVDYLEKSEDLLDDADEYRNN